MPPVDVACGIMVVVEAAGGATERLAAACAAVPVASVVVRASGNVALTASGAQGLIELAQSRGAAALIWNDARLARMLRADGVHLAVPVGLGDLYEQAREILGTRHIVGADAGTSSHEAMEVAERGADYVAFGVSDAIADRQAAQRQQLELVEWWAEIFEVPCVALDVTSAEDAGRLCEAGADFVAVPLEAGLSAADAAMRVTLVHRALAHGESGG